MMIIYDEDLFKKAQAKAEILRPTVEPLSQDGSSFEVTGRGDTYRVTFELTLDPILEDAVKLFCSCTCPAFIGGKEPTTDPFYVPKPCYHVAAAKVRRDEQLEQIRLVEAGYHQCAKPGCRALVPPTELLCPDCQRDLEFDQAVASESLSGSTNVNGGAIESENF